MNNLTTEEKNIENDIKNMVSISSKKKNQIDAIIARSKKNKAISLRMAEYDLDKLKEKAANEGIPYQTLINTILHKYITNQLLEKNEILKSIQLLTSKKTI